jgi:proline iminopeptidase
MFRPFRRFCPSLRRLGCAAVTAVALVTIGCLDDRALVPPTVDEDPSLPRLEVNGTVLHVTELGKRGDPLVVFVHGGPGVDHRQFLVWAPLADAGYHLVMYDQRGTGLSRREGRATYDVAHSIGDLDAVIHASRSGTEPVVLFTHSWGGMLATAYLNEDPTRVQGVIMAEPPGFTRAEVVDYFEKTLATTKLTEGTSDVLWTVQFLSPEEHARWDYLLLATGRDSEGQEGNDRAHPTPYWRWGAALSYWLPQQIGEFDWTTRLHEVTFPVLWFHSEKNQVSNTAQQEKVARDYPKVEMHLVAGVGHDLLYQREAELLPVVEDYLARVTQAVPQ